MTTTAKHQGIVVLGHPRSGTTLLRRLLDGHDNISCPGETHILSACARFLHAETTSNGVDMGVLAGLSFAGFSDAEVLARLRDMAFDFCRRHAEQQGKGRWAEKTAFDTFFIPEIERLCGNDAYFIGIIRHGLDVAMSCQDLTTASGAYLGKLHDYICRYNKPLEAFAHSWVETNQALLGFGQRHPDNCIICRYEDLLDEPEETLEALLDFVGEPFDAAMIGQGLGKVDEPGFSDHKSYQRRSITRQSVERWRELPEPQLHALARIVNPMLETCGYEALEEGTDLSVEEARHRYAMSIAINAARGDGDNG